MSSHTISFVPNQVEPMHRSLTSPNVRPNTSESNRVDNLTAYYYIIFIRITRACAIKGITEISDRQWHGRSQQKLFMI